ncbi:Adenosine monophosphate-protein transferase SoFic [Streptococcus intermedius]|uniref:Adenosine monophosphate-protein transferase SoFic n=2 Tax=Streptococcus intermedius TaxID=1338 RepID=A0AAE8G0M7_STRIT|nr:Adenosine monophosphate-protein transferase SoFic [Streptococcus intermedius]
MEYRSLKKIYYSDRNTYEIEYLQRLNGYGTTKTAMFPYLMKKNTFSTSQYPLFVVPLLDIQFLSQKIIELSVEITKLANALPDVAHQQFYNEQLFNAIISTNEIEGIGTTRKDVAAAIEALNKNKKGVLKHRSTVRMYLDILSEDYLHITELSHIREIYDGLTNGEIDTEDQLDGELFRKDSVSIVNNKTGKIEHIAPHSESKIKDMLLSWIDFINSPSIPFLIKASLAHYFFENIHPFYDGNGRTGRYILSKYLSRRLDKFSGLIISKKINEDKDKYYKAFSETGDSLNRADGTQFVHTILSFIIKGQSEIIETLSDKQDMLYYYHDKLKNSDFTEVERTILFLLVQSQLFVSDFEASITDNELLELLSHTEYSQRSIKQTIKNLEKKAVLIKVAKRPLKHSIVEEFFDYEK